MVGLRRIPTCVHASLQNSPYASCCLATVDDVGIYELQYALGILNLLGDNCDSIVVQAKPLRIRLNRLLDTLIYLPFVAKKLPDVFLVQEVEVASSVFKFLH